MSKRYTTDEEFISDFAKKAEIAPSLAKHYIEKFVESARECIDLNGYLTIRKFGTFNLRPRKKSKYKNPKTGEVKIIPLMHVIKFSPSVSFKSLVNAKIRKNLADARKEN